MLMMMAPSLRYFLFHSIYSLAASCSLQSAVCSLQMSHTAGASHHHGNSFKDTVNPLVSPPGGIFFSSTFEERLNRDEGE